MKKSNLNTNRVRFNIPIIIITLFLFCTFILKLLYLAISPTINGINIKDFVKNRNTKTEILTASRGNLYDQNGNILVQNIASYTVIAYLDEKRSKGSDKPLHVVDVPDTATKLSSILNMSVDELTKLLSKKDTYQVELGPGGRGITELIKEQIEKLDLPGIDFVADTKRYYPNGDFLSYVLGYAKKDENGNINGELGLEAYYNNILKGHDGYTTYQKDRLGYRIPNTKEITKKPKSGQDIYLTIDSRVQLFVEEAVKRSFKEYQPEWMILVMADAKTGKIIASTSSPSFDPNIRDIEQYMNPLVSYAYEPGSTMKTYTFMAAMEKGVYNGSDTYMSGKMEYKDFTDESKSKYISDWNKIGWGRITYDQGFALSSNIAIANLLDTVIDRNDLKKFLTKMGFGTKTGITLPNEVTGDLTFKYPIEVANAGFGQGITTTPIQHIQALTAIANNGIMLKPYIIDKIIDPNTNKVSFQSEVKKVRKVASSDTIAKIKALMYDAVHKPNGQSVGYAYDIDGYEIIGKTGTAEIFDNTTGQYLSGNENTIVSFNGMFPYDDPEIIIYGAMKKPKIGYNQGLIEAIRSVIINTSNYYNIYDKESVNIDSNLMITLPSLVNKNITDVTTTISNSGLLPIVLGDGSKVIKQYPNIDNKVYSNDKILLLTSGANITMPDITNWSSKEVIALCALINLNYELDGYGFVQEQSIAPNTLLIKDSKLTVKLTPKYEMHN